MGVSVIHGDSRVELQRLARIGRRFHSVVTDPPYALSTAERFGKEGAAPAQYGTDGVFSRSTGRFMHKEWDSSEIAFDPEFWTLVRSVMLPGAFCLAFASARTGYRQAAAMAEAGFVMYPMFAWVYATGMPKGHSLTKHFARRGGEYAELAESVEGWRFGINAIKPALEPIYVAQAPLGKPTFAENVRAYGVGAMNVEACAVPVEGEKPRYPANILHDGSDAVASCFGNSVERVFAAFPVIYHPKANADDRCGSTHPTVKPVALIRYLVKLVTPAGGEVLDPFAGSGSTGEAARRERLSCTLIEADGEYHDFIAARFNDRSRHIFADILGI